MQDWKINSPKLVSKKNGAYYQKLIQSKDTIQMVYPTAITTGTLGYLLDNNSLKNEKSDQFNRILINLKNKNDQNIYLANDEQFPVLMGGWSYISSDNEQDLTYIDDPLIIVFE